MQLSGRSVPTGADSPPRAALVREMGSSPAVYTERQGHGGRVVKLGRGWWNVEIAVLSVFCYARYDIEI